jgi:hypothetical protein
MRIIRFNIGEAFPAIDPVARFITAVAMMSNDWLRSANDLVDLKDGDPDTPGRRVALFRQQASLHHEAAAFITESRRRFPAIEAFLDGLSDEAKDECNRITGGIDPASPHYQGDWLADHRNVTFHYAELHPDKAAHGEEEMTNALTSAAKLEGTISMEENFGSVRFGFADEVAVQWLPDPGEQVDLIASLRESVMSLGRFAQRAAQAYMESRPDGTFTDESG